MAGLAYKQNRGKSKQQQADISKVQKAVFLSPKERDKKPPHTQDNAPIPMMAKDSKERFVKR